MREAIVVRFGAVVFPPLERLDRRALRRQLGKRLLDSLHLLRGHAFPKLKKQRVLQIPSFRRLLRLPQ